MGVMEKERKRIFLKAIEGYYLRWYDWGGQGPGGVDCSGLVVEGLRACGLMANDEDLTADDIWNKYRHKYTTKAPCEGAIVFWFGSNGKAVHTAVAIGPYHCIGAHGGDSDITDSEIAELEGAYVKYRPINYRPESFRCIDLFK